MVKLGNISAPEVSAWGAGSSGGWRTKTISGSRSGKASAADYNRAENERKQASVRQNQEMSVLNAQLEQAKTEEQKAQNRVDEYLFDHFGWLDMEDPAELEGLNAQAAEATKKRETLQTQVDALEYAQKYSEKTYKDNFFGQTAASYTQGRMNQDSALAWNDYWKEPTQENRDKAQTIDETLYQFQRSNARTLDGDAALPWLSQSTASQIPQVLDSVKYGAVGALGGAVVGSAVPVVGTAAGFKAGYAAGSGKYTYDTMRGAAFRDLLAQGVDEETARTAAGSEALLNGAMEAGDTLLDLTTLGAGTAAKKGIGYAANIGVGGTQEGLQTLVSTANLRRAQEGKTGVPGLVGDTAKLAWDALMGKDSETAQQAWSAVKEGMKVSAVLNGVAHAAAIPMQSKFSKAGSAVTTTPVMLDSEIESMKRQLAQMQEQQKVNELLAEYEKYAPLTEGEAKTLGTTDTKIVNEDLRQRLEIKPRSSNMDIGLQFFASKDLPKQKSSSIKKGIASDRKQIENHQNKIDHPELCYDNWESISEQRRAGLVKHWQKEIYTFQQHINDSIDELKKRGDYHD